VGTVNQRFFTSGDDIYELVRLQLDDVWGHGPGTGALTCYQPAATAPRDAEGRLVLAVRAEFCDYEAVAVILPGLLEDGLVEEIEQQAYRAAIDSHMP
jgi:hypothetical protein